MSKYAKAQEYRLQRHLEKMYGVKILAYYGSRQLRHGDFLITAPSGTKIRIDHKSTENDKSICIMFGWLYKLEGENLACQYNDGVAVPVITFSLKRHQQIYCLTDEMLYNFKLVESDGIYSHTASITITTIDLKGLVKQGQGLVIGMQKYIYTLQDFVNSF